MENHKCRTIFQPHLLCPPSLNLWQLQKFQKWKIITWKVLCFQDSKVSNFVSKGLQKFLIISRKPLNVSNLDSRLDPQNFRVSRVKFRESSFEGLSTYPWPVLYTVRDFLLAGKYVSNQQAFVPHNYSSCIKRAVQGTWKLNYKLIQTGTSMVTTDNELRMIILLTST